MNTKLKTMLSDYKKYSSNLENFFEEAEKEKWNIIDWLDENAEGIRLEGDKEGNGHLERLSDETMTYMLKGGGVIHLNQDDEFILFNNELELDSYLEGLFDYDSCMNHYEEER